MAEEELLTSSQAAAYLGLSRQAISLAAKAGAIGKRYGPIYMFTRAELDTWFARERHAGGRPKSRVLIPTPVIRVAA